MPRNELNRRDFHRLTGAALGGVLTGAALGCGKKDESPKSSTAAGSDKAAADKPAGDQTAAADKPAVDVTTSEMHVCRGLNICKGKGKGGDNECAGKGNCTLAEEHHCHAQNKCKGQGGCGKAPGLNACNGKGECAVPLSSKGDDSPWKKARAHFEAEMKKAGKPVGEAPAPPAKSDS